jgi:hypothetical protein
MSVAHRAFVLALAACGSSGASGDAAISDAPKQDASFPGCAPTSGDVCVDHLCWISPTPMEDRIAATGGSGCDTWLVGQGVYRMNGEVVTSVEAPPFPSDSTLGWVGISVFADRVWITGPATYRFDGKAWKLVDGLPGTAMWSDGPDDIWVIRKAVLSQWNGTQFLSFGPIPARNAVWGTSDHDVRANTITSRLAHWTGSFLVEEDGPVGGLVQALWASAPENWYAAGKTSTENQIWHHGVSGGWTLDYTEPNATFAGFTALWGASASDIWAGGPQLDHVLHYDGTAWSRVALPAGGDVETIHGVTGSDVVFAGTNFIARWDGSEIVPSTRNLPLGADLVWFGMYGSSESDVWIVADRGTVAHWDGAAWTISTIADGIGAHAISGTGPSDVWVAGDGPDMHVWHWDGISWTPTDLGTPGTLASIYATGPHDVWAAGDDGAIFHYDGTWQRTPLAVEAQIVGVWGRAADAWAVSSRAAYHWNGSVWSRISTLTAGNFTSVWGRSSSDVYFGTDSAELFRFDGHGLSGAIAPIDWIKSIGGDAERMWLVGPSHVAFNDGTGFHVMTAIQETWLGGYFPSRNDGWIAGTRGAVMRYRR